MPLQRLDHVNIRTENLDRTVEFYGRVLGLHPGDRPAFPFPGAWLYAGDAAVVHLIGVKDAPPDYREDQRLEHFALSATDLAGFLAHLRAENVPYWCRVLPTIGVQQVNILDCDGNHLHIDFAADEKADLTDFPGH
ncbi:MAG: VOC family protein [Alphaproteobacteria bacterium]|nr:VOC family protein [Alphaproteobacteria bacterium]